MTRPQFCPLFGGAIFVFWVSLSRKIVRKRYAGLTTAIVIACLCLFIRPWYGVISPPWFSIYGILSLSALGLCIEIFQGRWEVLGAGLGNLSCLLVTWSALGIHLHLWAPARSVPFLVLSAFVSGIIGGLLAQFVKIP